jgi:hypothetical protein
VHGFAIGDGKAGYAKFFKITPEQFANFNVIVYQQCPDMGGCRH